MNVHQYTVQICLLFLSSPVFYRMHMRGTDVSKMAPLMFYTQQKRSTRSWRCLIRHSYFIPLESQWLL